MSKASAYRDMSDEELRSELQRLQRDLFTMRMKRGSDLLPQVHLLKERRRDVARAKTVMKERGLG